MSLKFYMDSHIPEAVATQLRASGVDVLRCQEVGLIDASDVEHLAYASQQGRAIITKDADFPALHTQWMEAGKMHYGIFFCPYRNEPAIGVIVTQCLFYYNVIEQGAGTLETDINGQLHFIT